ncbi:Non-specific lipid-transfer C, cotyledon-specific-like protein [Gossypium arboreum]|uniref:Non-specific lipid-transfer C, cotyledon-specific-like protein n=1 Tax=Gossypium arboreum TaxID=29729 RepID=A0A0B0Q069_GOSAR|nr:Non-specific lipid-transfer C, cotyledon-specific-like protein [Gossypium arboreum]
MLFLLSFLFFLANNGEAAVPCTTVDANAAACLGFATGMAAKPSDACCNGLRQLAQTVKSDRFLSMIPQACNIKVDFAVSVNTNCETIH